MAILERATIDTVTSLKAAAERRDPAVWVLRTVVDVAALAAGAVATRGDSWAASAYAGVALLILFAAGGYRRQLSLSALDELPRLCQCLAVPLLALGAVSLLVDVPAAQLMRQAALSTALVVAGRAGAYGVIRSARRTSRVAEPTVVVGAGAIGIELHRLMTEHPEYGLLPIGILDDVHPEPGLPLVGSVADLDRVIADRGVLRVIVAYGPTGDQQLVEALRMASRHDVELHVVPRFFELGLAPTGPNVEHLWGIPLYRVRRAALQVSAWHLKRQLDVLVSGLALALLSPLFGLIALAVRLDSAGPVLFRQRRIGQSGREIEVLKFRTLEENDDADRTWSVEDDPRQTRVGRWLRRLSLDELPQLWNILRGDMSLVGPRPERPHFVTRFTTLVPGYENRHRLPVGLTGLAQVHGLRGDTSIAERARFDNYYIEHWSIWLDVKILLRTATRVLRDAIPRRAPRQPVVEPVTAPTVAYASAERDAS